MIYLRRKASQRCDTKHCTNKVPSSNQATNISAGGPSESSSKDSGWKSVQPTVLWRVSSSLEEVEHSFGDEKTSEDI